MKATLVAVHAIQGANRLAEGVVEGVVFEGQGLRAFLATNADAALAHIDRASAFAKLALTGFTGSQGLTPSLILEDGLAEAKERRLKRGRYGVYLVFEGDVEVEGVNLNATRIIGDYGIALDAIDKKPVRSALLPVVEQALAAIAMCMPSNAEARTKKLGEVIYLHADKPLYALNLQMGTPRISVVSGLTEGMVGDMADLARQLEGKDKLMRSVHLHSLANASDTDALLAFIAAWSSLEVFTSAMFKECYHRRWYELLSAAAPGPAKKVVLRFEEVMADKLRLADKFGVIASILAPEEAEQDIETFNAIKKTRDEFFHALGGDHQALPIDNVLALYRKYLRLHLAVGSWQ